MDASPLTDHVERFNEGIRSGNWEPMLSGFAPDAELVFEGGVPVGPFLGAGGDARRRMLLTARDGTIARLVVTFE